MQEKLTGSRMILLWAGYIAAEIATFVLLMWKHWPSTADGWETATLAARNGVLALVWPLYWGLLRWIF